MDDGYVSLEQLEALANGLHTDDPGTQSTTLRPCATIHLESPLLEADLMAVNVARLQSYRRDLAVPVTVDGDEETVNLTYKPVNMTTPAMATQIRLAQNDNYRSIELLATILAGILASWDLTNEGEPYPVTRDAIEVLDAEFLGVLVDAIVEDLPEAMTAMRGGQVADVSAEPRNRQERRAAAKA